MSKLFHINGKDEKAPIEAGDVVSDGVQVWRVVSDGGKLRLWFVGLLSELPSQA